LSWGTLAALDLRSKDRNVEERTVIELYTKAV
jgi:hypothetical protein